MDVAEVDQEDAEEAEDRSGITRDIIIVPKCPLPLSCLKVLLCLNI